MPVMRTVMDEIAMVGKRSASDGGRTSASACRRPLEFERVVPGTDEDVRRDRTARLVHTLRVARLSGAGGERAQQRC
eukprot:2691543-Prymnesium_polylepis.3